MTTASEAARTLVDTLYECDRLLTLQVDGAKWTNLKGAARKRKAAQLKQRFSKSLLLLQTSIACENNLSK